MADFRTYCNQNPYADDCLGMTDADWAALGYPVRTAGHVPSITILPGGAQVSNTTFDKTLAAILSGIALFQRAPYVPTNVQPQQQPIIYQQPVGQGNYVGGGGSTALGKVEIWLKNNTGVALMGAGALALYLMKSPKK